jgi:hypothetical protein
VEDAGFWHAGFYDEDLVRFTNPRAARKMLPGKRNCWSLCRKYFIVFTMEASPTHANQSGHDDCDCALTVYQASPGLASLASNPCSPLPGAETAQEARHHGHIIAILI